MLNRFPLPSLVLPLLAGSMALVAACSGGEPTGENVAQSEDALRNDVCRDSKDLQKDALVDPDFEDNDGDHDSCGPEERAERRGRRAFNDRKLKHLHANGRACADCHMASDNFQLSPATATARFDALQKCRTKKPNADDPLFRAIDADDFRTNGANASSFNNLKFGLIRITFDLHPNIKLIDPATNLPSAETFADVWRSVPSIKDVAITGADLAGRVGDNGGAIIGPNPNGGYQLDGRVLTLEDQALGALRAHAQIQGDPNPRFLTDVAAFQRAVFTSTSVAFLADAIAAGTTPLPDPDPPLDALEAGGKVTFQRICATCHGSNGHPSTSSSAIGQRYHSIRSQCPRQPVPAQAPDGPDNFGTLALPPCPANVSALSRVWEFTNPANGVKQRFTGEDIGRAFFTGRFVDARAFDVPSVRGASKTAPYFHNNSVSSIEELVEFYRVFFLAVRRTFAPGAFPPVISTDGVTFNRFLPVEEVPGLVAYLKKI